MRSNDRLKITFERRQMTGDMVQLTLSYDVSGQMTFDR